MRAAEVYNNGILAGVLTEEDQNHYVFRYNDAYFADQVKPAISLTLPKFKQEYHSEFLFPFFSNMVAEGTNLAIQCRYLKIDERDILSLLGATAGNDTIGAVTIKLIIFLPILFLHSAMDYFLTTMIQRVLKFWAFMLTMIFLSSVYELECWRAA